MMEQPQSTASNQIVARLDELRKEISMHGSTYCGTHYLIDKASVLMYSTSTNGDNSLWERLAGSFLGLKTNNYTSPDSFGDLAELGGNARRRIINRTNKFLNLQWPYVVSHQHSDLVGEFVDKYRPLATSLHFFPYTPNSKDDVIFSESEENFPARIRRIGVLLMFVSDVRKACTVNFGSPANTEYSSVFGEYMQNIRKITDHLDSKTIEELKAIFLRKVTTKEKWDNFFNTDGGKLGQNREALTILTLEGGVRRLLEMNYFPEMDQCEDYIQKLLFYKYTIKSATSSN